MADELRLLFAFGLALAAALAATPVAIAVAARTNFHDTPAGYKAHASPTPYLGGAAVLGGFLVATSVLGEDFERVRPIVLWTCALWVLGTLDDRFGLGAWTRAAAEALAGIGLWSAGLGWDLFPGSAADVTLTVIWVVGMVNAFNLIDNMDGAAATLAAVTGAGLGTLALVEGDVALAVVGAGLAGSCAGFLPYNLARPSRIFLGDGGSLVIGFVIAASLMALSSRIDVGDEYFLVAVLLAGLPVADTALVMISRRRAGLSVLTGGRDHLTHRLWTRLGTARTVALVLGLVQACLCVVAIGVVQVGSGSILAAWSLWFGVVATTIVVLEGHAWAPVRDHGPPQSAPGTRRLGLPGPVGPTPVELAAIAFISVACGLSPFFYGFYDTSVWGPIALALLAVLLGLLIARPAAARGTSLLAWTGLGGVWLWSLLSTSWAESADQALIDSNRWLLYVAMFGVLVLLVRNDGSSRVLIVAVTTTIVALATYLIASMLVGSAADLFLAGRLHEPLGYVNGQAGFLLLGLWPLVAVAERIGKPVAAGAAVAGASALVSLAILGQSRALIPAIAITAVVLLGVVPGRLVRAWALVFVLLGVLLSLGPVLDVYDAAGGGSPPGEGVLRGASLAILLASGVSGFGWWFAARAAGRIDPGAAQRTRRAASAVVVLAVVSVTLVGLISTGDPIERVRSEYRAFIDLRDQGDVRTRFTTGAGHRYDYWRVALDQFADNPVRGIGAGNYDTTYFRDRRTAEDVRQPHSIEMQTLSELGLVGVALVGLFLMAVLRGFVRRSRAAAADPAQRRLAVAAGGLFLVWLVHTSVDWLHLIPGLTGIALCAAAILSGPWTRSTFQTGRARAAMVVGGAAVILVGGVFVGRAALADRLLDDGRSMVASDPVGALGKATDSLALNDESVPAYYLRASAWARLDNYPRARQALVEATQREPHDPVSWALMGDLATRRGLSADARAAYAHARALNPLDPGLRSLSRGERAP